jgi:hypothetical protein
VTLDGRPRFETESIERVGTQVGQEDVRRREQLVELSLGVGLPQVQDHAALAPVVLCESRVGEVLPDAEGAEGAAHRIAVRGLDLDDVGTPVGQERAGRRCRHPDAHFDHA